MALFDMQSIVGKNRPQTTRRVEIPFRLDFSEINGGAGLAATEDAAVLTTPKGFVYEGSDFFLVAAEGAAGTLDIGITGDVDGLLDGGNMNGTPGARIAKAGTESLAVGTYLSETEIAVLVPAGQPTLDAAVLYGVIRGYTTELPAS